MGAPTQISFPTSVLTRDLFSRTEIMPASPFIKAMHPKAEIRPDAVAIEKILGMGWVGQLKIHGHRAQIHVSADENESPIIYNRQGKRHAIDFTASMEKELMR